MQGRYRLFGSLGSPYSMKMRAILRYRRLPFDWVLLNDANRAEIAHVKPAIIPVLWFPESGAHRVDSTPLIYDLERRHPGARSILPADPGHAFLAQLLEDMADEWGTKIMFHYRWAAEIDQLYVSRWLVSSRLGPTDDATVAEAAEIFRQRQVGRMPLVGCTPENAPLIEESFDRLLKILERHLTRHAFLFGSRPSLADFGWFGQLYQLAVDPTPMAILRERAPRTYQWVGRIDDASGVEGNWLDPAAPLPVAVSELLHLAGALYLPFLAANQAASERGEDRFRFSALGLDYAQATFRYQIKCLSWLREAFAGLEGEPRKRVEAALDGTGCLEVLRGV